MRTLGHMSPKFSPLKIWIYSLSPLNTITEGKFHLQRQVIQVSQADELLVEVFNSIETQPAWLNQTKYLLYHPRYEASSLWNCCGIDYHHSAVLKVCSYSSSPILLNLMYCFFLLLSLVLSSSSCFLKCPILMLFSPSSFIINLLSPSLYTHTLPKRMVVKLALCLLLSYSVRLPLYPSNPRVPSILSKQSMSLRQCLSTAWTVQAQS